MDKKYEDLRDLVKPIIDWLYENGSPYVSVEIKMDEVTVNKADAIMPVELRD